jgi:ubiquinone/menaquinone biosynthesis C-methylase UbiE
MIFVRSHWAWSWRLHSVLGYGIVDTGENAASGTALWSLPGSTWWRLTMCARIVNYDQAAGSYAAHRRVHSGVLRELYERVGLVPASTVLEVGCGTGNYICALVRHFNCAAYGLDPSAGMLAHARAQSEPVMWVQGRAEKLHFADDAFDLIFSVDVIHHVADQAACYREVARTLRPGGLVCTVTDSEEIIRRREILAGYFPDTVEIELARYPRIAQLETWMAAAGLVEFEVVTVVEPYELTSAQPFRAKAYSSLHLIPENAWRAGLERLERALARGPVQGFSRYACLWGRRTEEGAAGPGSRRS